MEKYPQVQLLKEEGGGRSRSRVAPCAVVLGRLRPRVVGARILPGVAAILQIVTSAV